MKKLRIKYSENASQLLTPPTTTPPVNDFPSIFSTQNRLIILSLFLGSKFSFPPYFCPIPCLFRFLLSHLLPTFAK